MVYSSAVAAVEDGSFLSLLVGLDKNRYGNITVITNTVTEETIRNSSFPSNLSDPLHR